MTVLVVTNDFPPRPGGIQAYVHGYLRRLPPGEVVVYAPAWKGAAEFDAAQPFPVVRHPTSLMLPVPTVARRAAAIAREHGADTVWFGAAAPLSLLTPSLRRSAGIGRAVASTHGHEVGWSMLPGARQALRRMGNALDAVTYLGEFTRSRIAPALGPHPALVRLPGGVDVEAFHPGVSGAAVRERWGIPRDARVVVCVSRLVPRKGQDRLVACLPAWRAAVPGTRLLLVGGGPDRSDLEEQAGALGVSGAVTITGSVPYEELPQHYAAGDVFAMPCTSRLGGLEVEGLGMVFLEAAACGLPVVAGNSGGSVDALVAGETGALVDGADAGRLREATQAYLRDPELARRHGAAGRDFVTREFAWDVLAPRLAAALGR